MSDKNTDFNRRAKESAKELGYAPLEMAKVIAILMAVAGALEGWMYYQGTATSRDNLGLLFILLFVGVFLGVTLLRGILSLLGYRSLKLRRFEAAEKRRIAAEQEAERAAAEAERLHKEQKNKEEKEAYARFVAQQTREIERLKKDAAVFFKDYFAPYVDAEFQLFDAVQLSDEAELIVRRLWTAFVLDFDLSGDGGPAREAFVERFPQLVKAAPQFENAAKYLPYFYDRAPEFSELLRALAPHLPSASILPDRVETGETVKRKYYSELDWVMRQWHQNMIQKVPAERECQEFRVRARG